MVFAIMFLAAFQFTAGPVVWVYISETMQDAGSSIATACNQFTNIVYTLAFTSLKTLLCGQTGDKDYTPGNVGIILISMGILSAFGFVFILCYMKETKGLDKQTIMDLFASEEAKAKRDQQRLLEGPTPLNYSEQSKGLYSSDNTSRNLSQDTSKIEEEVGQFANDGSSNEK